MHESGAISSHACQYAGHVNSTSTMCASSHEWNRGQHLIQAGNHVAYANNQVMNEFMSVHRAPDFASGQSRQKTEKM